MIKESLVFPEVYEQLELPNKQYSISKLQAEFIYFLLKETGITKTLEVGCCYACSTAYIIAATNATHYAIDPYQSFLWNNLGLSNLKKLNLDQHLRLEEDFSFNALPKLLKQDIKFDFAFIDGDHKFDYIMHDFYLMDMMMNIGGYILFDDTGMESMKYVIKWINSNRKDYQQLELPTDVEGVESCNNYSGFALFQKVNIDDRKWDFFEKF